MTESLLERSARFIDGAVYEGPVSVNPVDSSFHEIADGVALVCGFSHIWTLDCGEGLVVVDTSQPDFASAALEHLRRWRDVPVDTIVYTHGHMDHVGGAQTFCHDAVERRRPTPTVVAHDAVVRRFDRYDLTRDEIVNTVRVPADLLERPYLRPTYDEPEFMVRNIWRLYGGWYDANPARLKPAPDAAVAAEVATMAGGSAALARRAAELCEAGELRLACQLVEWAAQAAPDDDAVHAVRAEVYRIRRDSELSLMARNIFRDASYSSKARLPPAQGPD